MLLHTEDLTKDYGRFRALDALNLTVAPGEIFGLLGPNGSGKSTALRILLGFLRPSSGRAIVSGHDCWHQSVESRKHIAYLPGELRLYENMSGRQLVHFLARLRGQSPNSDVDRLAARFEIDLDRPLADFSSGMKRKVALLQVMVTHAPLLILDEPTNTLDPTMRDELLDQIKHTKEQGQAVLFSSHVLSEVEQVCDRVGILRRGKLVHLQSMSELRQGRLVRARFEGETQPLPALDGLKLRRQQNQQVELEYTGPLPPLLDWLSRQPIADLSLEPIGLAPIYQRLHGDEA